MNISEHFQRVQKDAQASSWKRYVSTLNSTKETGELWRKISKIKGKHSLKQPPILNINRQTIFQPKKVASIFAGHYAATIVKTRNLYPLEQDRGELPSQEEEDIPKMHV